MWKNVRSFAWYPLRLEDVSDGGPVVTISSSSTLLKIAETQSSLRVGELAVILPIRATSCNRLIGKTETNLFVRAGVRERHERDKASRLEGLEYEFGRRRPQWQPNRSGEKRMTSASGSAGKNKFG